MHDYLLTVYIKFGLYFPSLDVKDNYYVCDVIIILIIIYVL